VKYFADIINNELQQHAMFLSYGQSTDFSLLHNATAVHQNFFFPSLESSSIALGFIKILMLG
jgi:hypothetical protein